jgi:RNA polymerase sigma-70 factor (ECF subfamily)
MGTDDERDDLVQEVLIIILQRIGTLRDPACLDAWVFQITNNVLRYTLRQRGRRRQTFRVGFVEDESPLCHTDVEARDIASRVISVMERLSAKDRALLLSHWFSPGTLQTLADDSGCSVMTVRRRLNKARSRFERLLRRDRALGGHFEGLGQLESTRPPAPACAEESAA